MLKSYFTIALRNLARHKGLTAINVAGLAVGIACFLLIALWVIDELSYDRFHPNVDRLYRIVVDYETAGGIQQYAVSAAIMAKTMAEEIPEVQKASRLANRGMTVRNPKRNEPFLESNICFSDPAVFEMFTFEFIKGDAKTALSEPNTIVITEEMAHKYFGDSDPFGKALILNGLWLGAVDEREYRITGIIKDLPENTHLRDQQIFPSFATYEQISPRQANGWGEIYFRCYVRLQPGVSPAVVESKLPDMLSRHANPEDAEGITIRLQPVTDIHLYSTLTFDVPHGNIANVYIFSAIGLLILLIACINFMNFSTARSSKRSKEVGVKKVLGAARRQLIGQFLSEAIVASVFATILALIIAELTLPLFNELSRKNLSIDWLNVLLLAGLIVLALLVGVISGVYPAFFLSKFKPVTVLQGSRSAPSGGGAALLRKGLIILQFCAAVFLIIATVVVYQQLDYFQSKKLGFDKEQVAALRVLSRPSGFSYAGFKSELLRHPGITKVTRASAMPSSAPMRPGYKPLGAMGNRLEPMPTYRVDYDFVDLFALEFAAGRNFSSEFATDTAAFVINEAAAANLGYPDPRQALDKMIVQEGGKTGKIIGVVKNFHFASLRQEIGPLVMQLDPDTYFWIILKLAAGHVPQTLAYIEKTYRAFLPEQGYLFSFLDQRLNQEYLAEIQLGNIFGYFTLLAIFIACLGLYGLASFTAEQCTKEIGIRKILGATVMNVVALFSKDFVKLVLLANLIAWPAAYYAMNQWLQNFAYRIDIGWPVFVLAGCLALVIALLTVSTQVIKAALANPVEALRYE